MLSSPEKRYRYNIHILYIFFFRHSRSVQRVLMNTSWVRYHLCQNWWKPLGSTILITFEKCCWWHFSRGSRGTLHNFSHHAVALNNHFFFPSADRPADLRCPLVSLLLAKQTKRQQCYNHALLPWIYIIIRTTCESLRFRRNKFASTFVLDVAGRILLKSPSGSREKKSEKVI